MSDMIGGKELALVKIHSAGSCPVLIAVTMALIA